MPTAEMSFKTDQRLTAIPDVLPGTRFKIETSEAGGRLQLTEQAGFSFECHARAVLLVARISQRETFWYHNGGTEVSSFDGSNPGELRNAYQQKAGE